MSLPRSIAVGVLALLLVLPASAQTTTGRLSGTVVDQNGQALPGVTVTINSPNLIGGSRIAVTEGDGRFSFPAIAPGPYSIRFELSGFATQERRDVQVRLDRTTELDVTLPMATFAEEVRVVAESPVVDPTQVSTSQVFTSEYLTNATVGSVNRAYQSVLSQAPGVTGDANPNVFGSTEGENAYYVDGLDTTDPVTATFGTNFNFDAIQEINFQTGGFEAEYGRATGGVVNLITKSGGNDFSGTFDIRFRNNDFYESGDHFDPDENDTRFLNPSATFGGPIQRDRIWFFLSGEYIDSRLTPADSPTTRQYDGINYIGKATWQATPNWRVVAKVSGDPADIDNANASPFTAQEATRLQEQGGQIYQGEVAGIISPSLLLNVRAGVNRSELDSYPMGGDFDTPGQYDILTGVSYGNYTNVQLSDRDRDELSTDLTWFVDELAGSHEIKGGVNYSQLFFRSHNYTTGGGFRYENRVGNEFNPSGGQIVWFDTDPGTLEYDGNMRTAFLQDAWRVMPNLTLKLGVRWDQVSYETNTGSEIADLDKVQPRFGFAWDITGNARNVLRGSVGRFMHPNAMTLPSFARTALSTSTRYLSCTYYINRFGVETCADAAELFGVAPEIITDPLGLDPIGYFQFDQFGSAPNQIISNLRPTYADEVILAFERELSDRTSIELQAVDKDTEDIFEDTCSGNVTSPSPDAECDFYLMANLPQLQRDYRAYIVRFESRATDWMHLLASYTWARSRGNVEYTQNAGIDFDIFPTHFANRYGYLSDDRRHRVKLNGYFRLPGDFVLGVDSFWSSGFAFNRFTEDEDVAFDETGQEISIPYGEYYLDPRGSHRGADAYQIDLQLSKGFRVGGTNLQVIGVVYNVLGTENVTDVCETANFGSEPGCGVIGDRSVFFGGATEWQDPRRYEIGFRIEF